MSAPSEPEKYSIDEMMERLKNHPVENPLEDGELVTRADGSQAIRVRKRKRRSLQPHKEERQQSRRIRMIQVSAVTIALLLVAVVAGVAVAFANSASYRNNLIRKISLSSGATVELQQFRMNPTSANAERLTLTWPQGNALADLTLRGVKAEISPACFLGKSLTGEEVSCAEGSLNLRSPQPDQLLREAPATEGNPPIRFNHYAIAKAHVRFGNPQSPLVLLGNSEANFYPVHQNASAQLHLNRGHVTVNGWTKLRLDRAHIEFRGTDVNVVSMRLQHESDNRGIFELTGTVTPYTTDHASTLAVRLESYLVGGILGPELGRLFSGRIETHPDARANEIIFTSGQNPSTALNLKFRNSIISSFDVIGFPFLLELSRLMEDSWYEHPAFDNDVSGQIRRMAGNVTIDDLSLVNKGRMTLQGTVSMTPDHQLSGTLKIGLPNALILTSKSRQLDAMFGPSSDGYRWITLKISGTPTSPGDNFKAQFQAVDAAAKSDPNPKIPSFEDLTQPK